MRKVYLFCGQSNASGYSPMATLRGAGLTMYPGNPGSAPEYVPAFEQTAGNEWTGGSPASLDTGVFYEYPTDFNAPCLYNENATGSLDYVFDNWGSHVKEFPDHPSGDLADGGSYGLELSFLYRHLAVFPNTPIGAIKHSTGGTSLASDWLPANTGSNQTASDKLQWTILEQMVTEAAARLDADEPGQWEWGGFIWMQGESGAHRWEGIPADDNTYRDDARLFFAAVRSLMLSLNPRTIAATVPVIIGVIDDAWGWEVSPNPYVLAYDGNGYTAIDYSITSAGQAVDGTKRANALGGAVLRRATQRTLGGDANCTYWENDGYPRRPPVSLTAATTDETAYHWGHPGNLAAGERAFTAYYNAFAAPRRRLRINAGGQRLLLQTGVA